MAPFFVKHYKTNYLDEGEKQTHDEISKPIGGSSYTNCRRQRVLGKELSHDKPRDGAWTKLKEDNRTQGTYYTQVNSPIFFILKMECTHI